MSKQLQEVSGVFRGLDHPVDAEGHQQIRQALDAQEPGIAALPQRHGVFAGKPRNSSPPAANSSLQSCQHSAHGLAQWLD
jgi:hypothetical protein